MHTLSSTPAFLRPPDGRRDAWLYLCQSYADNSGPTSASKGACVCGCVCEGFVNFSVERSAGSSTPVAAAESSLWSDIILHYTRRRTGEIREVCPDDDDDDATATSTSTTLATMATNATALPHVAALETYVINVVPSVHTYILYPKRRPRLRVRVSTHTHTYPHI